MIDDEFTELVDADIPRVDLVDKAANGMRFLIAKQADGSAGLMPSAFVRELVAKSDPEPDGQVTMTGSPGALARLIHEAAQRAEPVAKAKYNADDRKRMAGNGQAMDDGSYPIGDRADLDNAIHAVGRGGADHNAIRRHVIARAKALGASSEIPDNWNADGSLKGAVAKELEMTDLDPTMILADPEETAPGNPTTPTSPAWEAIDAATARKWTAILARARTAVDMLAEREMLEAASGAEDDAMQACELQDACCAIDYAISILAPFAVAEQAESEMAEEMAMVGKALTGWDSGALDTIEALGAVRKAGRVLSAQNEAAIRGAVDSLQKVLASLPAAPTADDSGRAVAKTANEESDMPTPTTSAQATTAAGEQPAMGAAQPDPQKPAGVATTEVEKADDVKPQMRAVYDAKGRLIGVVDPADVTPIADAEPDGDEPDGDEGTEPAQAPADMTPEPSAEVGTPANAVTDGVTKNTTDNASDAVLKSIAEVVKAQFQEYSATQAQTIAEQAKALAAVTETLDVLKGQVTALEEQPATPKVFTNGAVPPPHMLRGHDRGVAPVDVAKAAELKKTLYAGTAVEQNQAAVDMQALAIAKLQEIHGQRR